AAPTGAARRVRGCARGSTWRDAGGRFSCPWSALYWKRIGAYPGMEAGGRGMLERSCRFDSPLPTSGSRPSGLLGFLADDGFVGVLHALALVRLGRTEAADLGGDFAPRLLVGAGDDDLGLGRRAQGDALRRREHDRVREAQREVEVLALDSGAVANAHQLELALEALGDAVDHVGDDRAQG